MATLPKPCKDWMFGQLELGDPLLDGFGRTKIATFLGLAFSFADGLELPAVSQRPNTVSRWVGSQAPGALMVISWIAPLAV